MSYGEDGHCDPVRLRQPFRDFLGNLFKGETGKKRHCLQRRSLSIVHGLRQSLVPPPPLNVDIPLYERANRSYPVLKTLTE